MAILSEIVKNDMKGIFQENQLQHQRLQFDKARDASKGAEGNRHPHCISSWGSRESNWPL